MVTNYTIEEVEYFNENQDDYQYLEEVELTVFYSVVNDSFDHEFGTEVYPDHAELEKVEWERRKYTEEENKAIDDWVQDSLDIIGEAIEL